MPKVHLLLQGKGGVGKSFVSALLAQFKIHQGKVPLCFDIDPVNATFSSYARLQAKHLDVMEQHEVNTRRFDQLIEEIVAHTGNDIIIDTGASTFIPLSNYLMSNAVPSLLNSLGYPLIIHSVITGGQAFLDTLNGFVQTIKQFSSSTRFVVWLNNYWGPIEHDGRSFERLKAYTEHQAQINAVLTIPQLKQETYGHDLASILKQHLTFDEALALSSLNLMTKQRLKIIQAQLFEQMQTAEVLS